MADLLSDADVGLAPASPPAPTAAPVPVSDPTPSGVRPLKVTPAAAPKPALLSDADVGLAPSNDAAASSAGQGPLGNTQDDGWLSGAAKGAGTAVIKGLSHIPGMFGDINDLGTLLAAGSASIFDKRPVATIYAEMQANRAAQARDSWISPDRWVPNSADISTPILAKTGEYKPTSEVGSLAQAGVEAAVGGLGPGAGAAKLGEAGSRILLNTVKQAPLNALAGVAGQGATDATGNPYIGLAASIAAPGVAEGLGRGAGKLAAPFAEDLPIVGNAFDGTRDARVGQQIIGSADDPNALKTSLGIGTDAATAQPAVPGSTPTLGQMSGDLGILKAEEQARTAGNVDFLHREEDQNSARGAALSRIAPADADTMLPSQYLQQQGATIDQAGEAAQARILQHARDLAAQLGPGQTADQNGAVVRSALDRLDGANAADDAARVAQARQQASTLGAGEAPEMNGQTIRDAQEAAKQQARALRAKLYAPETLDPDGKINLVMTPAVEAGKAIAADVDPLGEPLGGDVSRILDKVKTLPAVLPYKSVMALDRDITTSMAKERKANGESTDWGRLSRLKSGIMDSIHNALDNQHAYEQSAVQTGKMSADQTMAARIKSEAGGWYDGQGEARRGVAVGSGDDAAAGSAALSAAPRTQGQGGGQLGLHAGDPGLSDAPIFDDAAVARRPTRPSLPKPQTLHDFIRAQGGVRDPGGDLKSMGLDRVRGLIAPTGSGLSPDAMRRVAAEAGYLGADTDHAMRNTEVNDLLDAVGSGKNIYSVFDEHAVHAWDDYRAQREQYDHRPDVVGRPAAPLKAPLSAYRQEDAYPPGMAPNDAPANDALRPYADPGFADRLAEAKAAHADYAQTFRQGVVGQDLKTNGFAGQYRTGDGALAGKILPQGPGGYDVMKARLKAIGGNEAGLRAIQDQALAPLRSQLQDGMLPQKAIDAWRARHDGALRALDEAVPGFSTRYDAAGRAHAAVTEARGAADSANVTRRYAGPDGAMMGRAIRPGDVGYGTLKTLLDATGNDPRVIGAVKDQIVQPLRASLLPDGTVAPRAHKAWAENYGPALRAINEVSPGFSKKFGDAAKATDILTRAGEVRKARTDAFQQSAAAKLLGKTSPDEVGATILSMLSDPKKGSTQVREVRQALSGNPDALAGAQKAAVDAIAKKFLNTAESGTSGEKSIASAGFQKFVANHDAALRELLPAHAVNTLRAIAADLERANRDVTGTRIKGTSQTAKNQHGLMEKVAGGHVGHSALALGLVEGLMQAYEHGGLHGAALAAIPLGAGYALNKARTSGIAKEHAMFRDALLNPDRARYYLTKLKPGDGGAAAKMLVNSLRRELIAAPVVKESAVNR